MRGRGADGAARRRAGVENVAGAHSVGVLDGGPGLPVVGWSTAGGDLRVGHFVGLHALQALPILAMLLTRFGTRLDRADQGPAAAGGRRRVRRLTMLLTWQALRGQPLIRPDALTLTAWGLLGGRGRDGRGPGGRPDRRADLALAA